MNRACTRLFERWLALSIEFRGRATSKTKPTKEEEGYLAGAQKQANEAELMNMLDWAFHGTDDYALLLQGKRSFDDRKAKPFLGIDTLFKDTKLAKRIELGDDWAHRGDNAPAAPGSPVYETWLETVAIPALHAIIQDPDAYAQAYEWWSKERGAHDGGASSDTDYAKALLRLRQWRNAGGL